MPGLSERNLLLNLAARQGGFLQYQKILAAYPNLTHAVEDNFAQITRDRLRQKLQAIDWTRPTDQRGFAACTCLDSDYPGVFRELREPPLVFWYEGDLTLLETPCISIVGSRRVTPHTRRYLLSILPGVVAAGLTTVSGLAYGVDEAVHRLTLEAGGRTVAVLGNGLDEASHNPRASYRLSRSILEDGGLVLSEFPAMTKGARYTFPRRNRLVAALSHVTLVAQAAPHSGSLITARWAQELHRSVLTPTVDYFEESVGGNRDLITQGAGVVTSVADILRYYPDLEATNRTHGAGEKVILDFDGVCAKFGLDSRLGLAEVTRLELTGQIKPVGVGEWVVG